MTPPFQRVTPRRATPQPLAAVPLTHEQRVTTHMVASLLLDYPDEVWFSRMSLVRESVDTLPAEIRTLLRSYLDEAMFAGPTEWQRCYVTTFDLKRKCSLYLSYYATGDTRRRGVALVTFLDAHRAAGWEFDADELPDYLPAVLEFSARSNSEIASGLLASHREGIEVLRAALEALSSPWALVVKAVTLSLPPIDDVTRDRFLSLVNEGPPTETVGLSFHGNLPPFSLTAETL